MTDAPAATAAPPPSLVAQESGAPADLHIDMVSDLACPWCWVGLRQLGRAVELAARPGPNGAAPVRASVAFRPFQLDPAVPAEGTDYKAYMRARFGSDTDQGGDGKGGKSRSAAVRDALLQLGAELGIPFDFGRITVRANTTSAHRLVHWAQGQGLGWQAKEALFAANFAEGRNIGDLRVLAGLADDIGMDGEVVGRLLASGADLDAVAAQMNRVAALGIAGVPTFVANGRSAVQGAEPAEKLARFFRDSARAGAGA